MQQTHPTGRGFTIALLLISLAGTLAAQRSPRNDTTLVKDHGRGPTTYVLISGLIGGTDGFAPLDSALRARGARVVTIDPYRLSIDSSDVTFAALARRVDRVLAESGVDSAVVVGHAHGAGVALRLAATYPRRVAALYFLDVGALASNKTKVFSASLRLAPIIARFPGGKSFLRGQLAQGLRENSGHKEWLDRRQRIYTDPIVDNISRVVSMAMRLKDAKEPEPVESVIRRVRVPITVLVGDAPHPAAPDPGEVDRLLPLGPSLQVRHLAGAGHFVHEEETGEVGRIIAGGR